MNIKRGFVLLIGITFMLPLVVSAEGFRGRIVKSEGDVTVITADGESVKPQKLNNLLKASETIVTEASSRAVIQFSDGSMAVLNERSKLLVEKSEWLSQIGGKIYFAFKKVFGKKPRKIKTSFVTLGIRGTSFIVDVDEGDEAVALQEGSLNVESPGDDFELHKKKKPEDDFAAYMKQQQQQVNKVNDEFSAYKKQINEEFVEYVKQFTLEPNKMISFNGNRVDETGISDELRKDFGSLEDFAGDFLDEYKN
ncbi:MAG: FecR domain-containing protein [Gammaproteobacteria bacterium]|nr:FecR domain-containing protein [Gammaproteobacteria bacterium]